MTALAGGGVVAGGDVWGYVVAVVVMIADPFGDIIGDIGRSDTFWIDRIVSK